jgi:hypothetical protein
MQNIPYFIGGQLIIQQFNFPLPPGQTGEECHEKANGVFGSIIFIYQFFRHIGRCLSSGDKQQCSARQGPGDR